MPELYNERFYGVNAEFQLFLQRSCSLSDLGEDKTVAVVAHYNNLAPTQVEKTRAEVLKETGQDL